MVLGPAPIAAAVVAGAGLAQWWSLPAGALAATAVAAGLLGWRGDRARWPWWIMVFAAAGLFAVSSVPVDGAGWTGVDDHRPDLLEGTVAGLALDSPAGRSVVVQTATGALAELTIAHPAPDLADGDVIQVRTRLRTVGQPASAGARPSPRPRAGVVAYAKAKDVALVRAGSGSIMRWASTVQREASARMWSGHGHDRDGAVLVAMVLGDRRGLDQGLRGAFADSGVAHVLAVSGLHIGLVAWLCFGLLRRLLSLCGPLARRIDAEIVAAPLAAILAIAFALITGARISTLRAVAVATIVLAGLARARRVRVIDALGVVAVALVLADPQVVTEVSFQLSFAAATTLSIALGRREEGLAFTEPRRWSRVHAPLIALVRASCWAQLATAPLVAWWFGEFAPAGLVANLTVVPLVEFIVVPVALLGLGLSSLAVGLGSWLIAIAKWTAGWVVDTAEAFAVVLGPLDVGVVSTLEVVLASSVVIAALAAARGVITRRHAALVATAFAVLVVGGRAVEPIRLPRAAAPLVIEFVDIGQGDAALISWPDGSHWLIDTGGLPYVEPRPGESAAARRARASFPARRVLLPLLRVRRVKSLAVIVLSHRHPDHYGGLQALLGEVEIGEIWLPGDTASSLSVAASHPALDHASASAPVANTSDLDALLGAQMRRGTRVRTPALGRQELGDDLAMEVLAPAYGGVYAVGDPVMSVNDNSLVIAIERAGTRVLFAGDLEEEGEERLVEAGYARADVVKVAHHGSPTSSTPQFVAAVGARLAIISCAKGNGFGFPSAAVLARWRDAGTTVARTDVWGTIRVEIDGDGAIHVRNGRRR